MHLDEVFETDEILRIPCIEGRRVGVRRRRDDKVHCSRPRLPSNLDDSRRDLSITHCDSLVYRKRIELPLNY